MSYKLVIYANFDIELQDIYGHAVKGILFHEGDDFEMNLRIMFNIFNEYNEECKQV